MAKGIASYSSSWLPFVLLSLVFHLVYTSSIFLIYFTSPVVHPSRRFSAFDALRPDNGSTNVLAEFQRPAERLVLIVGDGLRADTLFRMHEPSQLPLWARADLKLWAASADKEVYPFDSALRYDKLTEADISGYEAAGQVSAAPFLRRMATDVGAWGISHTRVPTESRPGHVAMIAGMYEDVSAVTRGWKSNPLPFDSVLNQSSHAFAFGSPDIVPMFVRGGVPGRIDQFCYAEEDEDFTKDATHLDLWVLDRVRDLFARARLDTSLDATLRAPGTVFFLHLLGPDTTGHTFRPHSQEYIGNAIVVDAIAYKIQQLFEDFFEPTTSKDSEAIEHRTAYIFTADHGMSNLGNHGDGEPDNTRTPLIAWGAGVRRPKALGSSTKDTAQRSSREDEKRADPYFRQWGEAIDGSWREDVEQADITALMASLAGLSVPANSEGRLPLNYLSAGVHIHQRAMMHLANARQILEMYRVKHDHRVSRMIRYTPYKPFAEITSLAPGDLAVAEIINLINDGSYELAYAASDTLIDNALAGLQYLQTYDWLLLVSIVTIGYIGSMLHGIIFLLRKYILGPAELARSQGPADTDDRLGTVIGVSAFVAGAAYFQAERSPVGYTVYFAFAVFFWSRIVDGRHILLSVLRSSEDQAPRAVQIFSGIVVAVAALELMVVGYLERKAWSLGFLVLGLVWPLLSFDGDFRAKNRNTVVLWGLTCVATATFMLGKTDKDESIPLLAVSGVISFALGAMIMIYPCFMIGPATDMHAVDTQRTGTVRIIAFELVATVISTIITTSSARSLQQKKGLPLLNQVSGWILLISCLTIPLYALIRMGPPIRSPARGGKAAVSPYAASRRLVVLIFAFPPIFILLSLRDETLFFVSYTLTLLVWAKLEVAASTHDRDRGSSSVVPSGRRPVRLRTALTYLFLLHVGFFGTGNVASISSFYLSPVYRVVPVFHPFTMAALLLLKIQVPFIVLACIFHLLCVAPAPGTGRPASPASAERGLLTSGLGQRDAIGLVQVACLCTDVLALSFLFSVRTTGSWLEIGRTITHFVMANMLHVFMLALAVLAQGVVGKGAVQGTEDGEEPENRASDK